MKKKETKYSLEKEIREALASGRSQKSIYNTLKDGNDDSVLADKVAEYLPLEVRNKTKYYKQCKKIDWFTIRIWWQLSTIR